MSTVSSASLANSPLSTASACSVGSAATAAVASREDAANAVSEALSMAAVVASMLESEAIPASQNYDELFDSNGGTGISSDLDSNMVVLPLDLNSDEDMIGETDDDAEDDDDDDGDNALDIDDEIVSDHHGNDHDGENCTESSGSEMDDDSEDLLTQAHHDDYMGGDITEDDRDVVEPHSVALLTHTQHIEMFSPIHARPISNDKTATPLIDDTKPEPSSDAPQATLLSSLGTLGNSDSLIFRDDTLDSALTNETLFSSYGILDTAAATMNFSLPNLISLDEIAFSLDNSLNASNKSQVENSILLTNDTLGNISACVSNLPSAVDLAYNIQDITAPEATRKRRLSSLMLRNSLNSTPLGTPMAYTEFAAPAVTKLNNAFIPTPVTQIIEAPTPALQPEFYLSENDKFRSFVSDLAGSLSPLPPISRKVVDLLIQFPIHLPAIPTPDCFPPIFLTLIENCPVYLCVLPASSSFNTQVPLDSHILMRCADSHYVNASNLLTAAGVLGEVERSVRLSVIRSKKVIDKSIGGSSEHFSLAGSWVPLDVARSLASTCIIDSRLKIFFSDNLPTMFPAAEAAERIAALCDSSLSDLSSFGFPNNGALNHTAAALNSANFGSLGNFSSTSQSLYSGIPSASPSSLQFPTIMSPYAPTWPTHLPAKSGKVEDTSNGNWIDILKLPQLSTDFRIKQSDQKIMDQGGDYYSPIQFTDNYLLDLEKNTQNLDSLNPSKGIPTPIIDSLSESTNLVINALKAEVSATTTIDQDSISLIAATTPSDAATASKSPIATPLPEREETLEFAAAAAKALQQLKTKGSLNPLSPEQQDQKVAATVAALAKSSSTMIAKPLVMPPIGYLRPSYSILPARADGEYFSSSFDAWEDSSCSDFSDDCDEDGINEEEEEDGDDDDNDDDDNDGADEREEDDENNIISDDNVRGQVKYSQIAADLSDKSNQQTSATKCSHVVASDFEMMDISSSATIRTAPLAPSSIPFPETKSSLSSSSTLQNAQQNPSTARRRNSTCPVESSGEETINLSQQNNSSKSRRKTPTASAPRSTTSKPKSEKKCIPAASSQKSQKRNNANKKSTVTRKAGSSTKSVSTSTSLTSAAASRRRKSSDTMSQVIPSTSASARLVQAWPTTNQYMPPSRDCEDDEDIFVDPLATESEGDDCSMHPPHVSNMLRIASDAANQIASVISSTIQLPFQSESDDSIIDILGEAPGAR